MNVFQLPNHSIKVVRKGLDGNALPEDVKGGVELAALYVTCSKCDTPNLLAKWIDRGADGGSLGTLNCNECNAPLVPELSTKGKDSDEELFKDE